MKKMMFPVLIFGLIALSADLVFAQNRAAPTAALAPTINEQWLNHQIARQAQGFAKKHALGSVKEQETDGLTAETQAVILSGIVQTLKQAGLHFDELKFFRQYSRALEASSRMGLLPNAITIGYMYRYQAGLGASIGHQFNFFVERGVLKYSRYTMYQGQIGYAYQNKVEAYASLCFGTCFGGGATGNYIGLDGYAAFGLGGGLFVEGGFDTTDLLRSILGRSNDPYRFSDLIHNHAFYIGYGIDFGYGAGITMNLIHYRLDEQKVLSRPYQKLSPKMIEAATRAKLKFVQP